MKAGFVYLTSPRSLTAQLSVHIRNSPLQLALMIKTHKYLQISGEISAKLCYLIYAM